MSNANKQRRMEPTISQGDLMFLSTKNLNLPKRRAPKLCPKFVGLYKVAEAHPNVSTYMLELPMVLQECRIIPTFHVSLLRPYYASNDALFPNRVHPEPYDFGTADDQKWFVDKIVSHRWNNGQRSKEQRSLDDLKFEIRWSLGDMSWEK